MLLSIERIDALWIFFYVMYTFLSDKSFKLTTFVIIKSKCIYMYAFQ